MNSAIDADGRFFIDRDPKVRSFTPTVSSVSLCSEGSQRVLNRKTRCKEHSPRDPSLQFYDNRCSRLGSTPADSTSLRLAVHCASRLSSPTVNLHAALWADPELPARWGVRPAHGPARAQRPAARGRALRGDFPAKCSLLRLLASSGLHDSSTLSCMGTERKVLLHQAGHKIRSRILPPLLPQGALCMTCAASGITHFCARMDRSAALKMSRL